MTTLLSPNILIKDITADLGFTDISNLNDATLIKTDELISIATFSKV